MRQESAGFIAAAALLALLLTSHEAPAYSVLAHEAMIDAAWEDVLAPMVRRQYPEITPEALLESRAYAYGGSLIHDLGYYPFGSRVFSHLAHYVRTGDFVEALIRESQNANEYAFALGALAHYVSDNLGHPIAVNRAVPIIYPKFQQKYGSEVLYADSPSRHVKVEFAFDVVQVARGTFKSDVYQDLIGFEVARPVLERAVRSTYGLELGDLFGDVDLAIGTYRKAASEIIPDITRAAWREKRDEILAATPGITEQAFVYTMTRRKYEEAFGRSYRKPSPLARLIVLVLKVVPKVGPFKVLGFEPLTPETERMFLESFQASMSRYRDALGAARTERNRLLDSDLDTGKPSAPGLNPLADETYAELLARLAEQKFSGVSADLRLAINAYYTMRAVPHETDRKSRKREREVRRYLAALNATSPVARTVTSQR